MFEQSAPKDWSRAFPPAEDESPSDSAEPAAGPAKSPLPPYPRGELLVKTRTLFSGYYRGLDHHAVFTELTAAQAVPVLAAEREPPGPRV